MKYTYEQIEALLLQKEFDELTPQERAGLGLSAAAYQQQQQVLRASKQVLSSPIPPPPSALGALKQQFEQVHPPTAWWKRPVPLYHLLLLVGLVVALWWWRPTTIKEVPVVEEKVVYVPQVQIDTILEERVRVEEKVIYRIKEVPVLQIDTIYLLPPSTEYEQQQFYKEEQPPANIFAKEPKSKSMKDLHGLMDLVVGED